MDKERIGIWSHKFIERAKKYGFTALVAMAVSGLVSTGISAWFAARMENSKIHASMIMSEKAGFDASQNNIFGQLALYTDKLINKDGSAKKDELQKAIVSAQLQLARLRDELPEEDRGIVTQYSNELETFLAALRNVTDARDLKPIYVSAQKLLVLNDRLADTVRNNLTISP